MRSVEKERVLAQAAAEQANKERDALVAEQSRLEEISGRTHHLAQCHRQESVGWRGEGYDKTSKIKGTGIDTMSFRGKLRNR